jgi:hypothetical protein
MFDRRGFAAVLAALLLAPVAAAQVTYPPRPDTYDVQFRYRIGAADRDGRILQYRALTDHLKAIGFAQTEREDADLDIFDPTHDRVFGTLPSKSVARLFEDPRVRTVLLLPAGTQPPEDVQKPTEVRLSLATGFAPAQQKLLHEQAVSHLGKLGFVEAIGYDHAGFTLARGRMPWANVAPLLRDLRYLPGGWFLAGTPLEFLPSPLKVVQPVRLIEVLPDPTEAAAAPPAPGPLPGDVPPPSALALSKMTDDLRAAIYDPERQSKATRVELVFRNEPLGGLKDFEISLRAAADGARTDGLVGTVGSARLLRATDAIKVAELPEVQAVRLPRAGEQTARQTPADTPGVVPVGQLLQESRVGLLHQIGYRGQGTRAVLIAGGFPGAAALIGKQLPANTAILDLTAELEPSLSPAPESETAGGTAAALAFHAAAPDAQLTLLRVDPASFHQVITVARAVTGDKSYSVAMQTRSVELVRRGDELSAQRTAAVEEYRRAFSNLSDEDGPRRRRDAARGALTALVTEETAYRDTVKRFVALKAAVDGLAGTGVVVNTLVWEVGFPHDGLSQLSQLLDAKFVGHPLRSAIKAARQPKVPAWVQAGSDSIRQIWTGPYLDGEDDGVMAFAPEDAPLPAGRWTRELNFLGFQPAAGEQKAELPAGLKVRVTVQWREPHDAEDPHEPDPVHGLRLRLLRQIDPTGKTVPSDEMVEVARSTGPTIRLMRTPGSGVYELSMLVTVPVDGVYALRVERAPVPPDRYGRPRHADLRPRVVLQLAEADAAKGRAVFATFAPQAVGIGIAGDSPAAVTVGIGGGPDYRTPLTPTGAGPGVTLRVKPDLLTAGVIGVPDGAGVGSGMSAAFVGGAAASVLSAGVRAPDITAALLRNPGVPLVLPTEWLTRLVPPGRITTER